MRIKKKMKNKKEEAKSKTYTSMNRLKSKKIQRKTPKSFILKKIMV